MKFSKILTFTIFLIFLISILPASQAHVLVVADADHTAPDALHVAKDTADALKAKGYNVLELYGENATTKNILKVMYDADAVIYAGHGIFIYGNYDDNGGPATPPFGMLGSDGVIWGYGEKMWDDKSGRSFVAPFKKNIPVILFGTCFSSGWVEYNEVANPTETIYSFSQMFTGAGANYYATAYVWPYQGKDVVDLVAVFLDRKAGSLGDANQKNYGFTISQESVYKNQVIWHDDNGYNAFVGNWNATFPQPDQTTPYNDTAAEEWYNGNLPSPTGELPNAQRDLQDRSLDELIDEILGWIHDLINDISKSDVPAINITHSSLLP